MAITSAQIAAFPDYTDAEIVKMLKGAIIGVTLGQSYTMPTGQTVTKANLKDIKSMLEYFEARVNTATNTDTGGDIVLVERGGRV